MMLFSIFIVSIVYLSFALRDLVFQINVMVTVTSWIPCSSRIALSSEHYRSHSLGRSSHNLSYSYRW